MIFDMTKRKSGGGGGGTDTGAFVVVAGDIYPASAGQNKIQLPVTGMSAALAAFVYIDNWADHDGDATYDGKAYGAYTTNLDLKSWYVYSGTTAIGGQVLTYYASYANKHSYFNGSSGGVSTGYVEFGNAIQTPWMVGVAYHYIVVGVA